MFNFLNPPSEKPFITTAKIEKTYKQMRLRVFMGAFLGYAAYYLVRKNLALAIPGMTQSIENGGLDYTKAELGFAMSGLSIAYAFSKFIMGSISDRSDARKFLVIGLILASTLMMSMGLFSFMTSSIAIIFTVMLFAGWISGMGWPPCGRVMVHWFSHNERSFKMSIWNTSHTFGSGLMGNLATWGTILIGGYFIVDIGGGVLVEQSWRSVFAFPAAFALIVAFFCWWAIRDTPRSCGLPPIDQYRNDFTVKKELSSEAKIPISELFFKYILKNKVLWVIALANAFVYLVRYGIGDWAPTYLQETGMLNAEQSKLAFAFHNYAGVPGTIVCGLISAKLFKGRCAPANVLFMLLVLLSILLYWQASPIAAFISESFTSNFATTRTVILYLSLIAVGFFIYGPVALIGVQAINLVPKNAAGTAAGFVGLFGYLFGDAALSKILIGKVVSNRSLGWETTFWIYFTASILAILFSITTWKKEKQSCSV